MFSFYSGENWGPETLNTLSKVIQLFTHRSRMTPNLVLFLQNDMAFNHMQQVLIWAFILHTGSQNRKSDSHPKLLDPAYFQGIITHWFCSCPLTHPQRVRIEEVVYETLVSLTSTGWQRPLVHDDEEGSQKPIAVAERAPAWGREDKFIHPQC